MKFIEFYPAEKIHFDIVQIGAGGTGGYVISRLAKLISSLTRISEQSSFSYTVVDADQVRL